jgi:hypothetical protein
MIERFLLDGIDTEAAGPAAGGKNDFTIPTGSDETKAALAVAKFAQARADLAFDAAVGQGSPIAAGMGIGEGFRVGQVRHLQLSDGNNGAVTARTSASFRRHRKSEHAIFNHDKDRPIYQGILTS